MLLQAPLLAPHLSRSEIAAQLRLLADRIDASASSDAERRDTPEDALIVGTSAAQKPSSFSCGDASMVARQLYAMRRRRDDVFDTQNLFAEPAWDLLLDLFIAARHGKRVPVTSACIGAAVPPTTALRWLNLLERRGFVLRDDDPTDARRIYVRISPSAEAILDRLLLQFAAALTALPLQADRRPNAAAPA